MYTNILYVLATASLFIGSVLTFDRKFADYFYLVGTTLFFIKALIVLATDIKNYERYEYDHVFNV